MPRELKHLEARCKSVSASHQAYSAGASGSWSADTANCPQDSTERNLMMHLPPACLIHTCTFFLEHCHLSHHDHKAILHSLPFLSTGMLLRQIVLAHSVHLLIGHVSHAHHGPDGNTLMTIQVQVSTGMELPFHYNILHVQFELLYCIEHI